MKPIYHSDYFNIWMGSRHWDFLLEVMLKSVIMFVVVVIFMRVLGKRGVMQLSVFELVMLLILGSSAGDPMLYREVGLLPAFIVFIFIVSLYRAVIFLLSRSRKFEVLIKGRPQYLIKAGKICLSKFRKEPLAFDEFYAELRMQQVSQLGQVRYAIIETSGEISTFFYPPEETKYGLQILPDSFEHAQDKIETPGQYSCTFCGDSDFLEPTSVFECKVCHRHHCIPASNEIRIS
jgi:uncharacterized membrane protein YcaP (DUF421 family)